MRILEPGIAGKAFAVWLGILVLAIANGALRDVALVPAMGSTLGLAASGVLLSVLILAVAYFALPWFGAAPFARYIAIGLGWLLLTLVFELTFGRLIQGKPWPEILAAYSFKNGNLWPVVLLVTAVAPYVAAKIRSFA